MSEDGSPQVASTTDSVKAQAQTRTGAGGADAASAGAVPSPLVEGTHYEIGPRVTRAVHARPYERQPQDPLYRPLRIYTLDPESPKLEGSVALVNVPYEPLLPGPTGRVFKVSGYDSHTGRCYGALDLDDPKNLLQQGRTPSPSDPLFHQQMVYAVCSMIYAHFRQALGRHLTWGFDPSGTGRGCDVNQLLLRPYAMQEQNAYYNRELGQLCFGYFPRDLTPPPPGATGDGSEEGDAGPAREARGYFFTSLSHDIVTHEITHALLDGLRASFTLPTGRDVLAFHEALADLVAVFQHFSYSEVVRAAIRKSRGALEQSDVLTDIAMRFGYATGAAGALRTAIDVAGPGGVRPHYIRAGPEPHRLGQLLVSAVFEAFTTVFRRKTARYVRLATGGTGELPRGELPADLQAVLAEEASQLANQFLSICIRAIDYCPPVDLEFGEYLRALVTADYELVPDDPWGYREALIDAFRHRGIFPDGVVHLSEDALRWGPPPGEVLSISELSFAELQFSGDPAQPADESELKRQARVLAEFVMQGDRPGLFGLSYPGRTKHGDEFMRPCVESIRSSRRVGPDGQVVFDLVAEITQIRRVLPRERGDGGEFDLVGGSTVIVGPKGEVRYTINKSVRNEARLERQRRFVTGREGGPYWQLVNGRHRPKPNAFRLLHEARCFAGR